MSKVAGAVLVALSVLLTGCGNTSTTISSNGSFWEATLIESSGAATQYDFDAQFSIAGSGSLSVNSITFFNSNPCFVSGQTGSGQAVLTVDTTTEAVTGTLDFNVQSGTPSGNALQLTNTSVTGTESGTSLTGAVVTGDWTLTGSSGCTNGGTFTLRQQ
jgi:hypothetical protein